jgi:NADPH-dependent ferric siderophore reductase
MAESLMTDRTVRPERASVRQLSVCRVQPISSGFRRITLVSEDPGFGSEFGCLGFDQWLRLFLPNAGGVLEPPYGDIEGWYGRWLGADEGRRPVIRNYTVLEARRVADRWEIDIDFVMHAGPSGEIEGVAAGWALAARPGDQLAVLDQGRIFDADAHDGPIMIISDESGLPGVEGIARSLAGRPATYLLEVPHDDDQRELAAADPQWFVRDPRRMPGGELLGYLEGVRIDPSSYVYAVGEAAFMLRARELAKIAGVRKDKIDFCAYWRPVRRSRRS